MCSEVREPLTRSTGSLTAHDPRIARKALFMSVAELYSQRASCPRGAVGCVAVAGGRVVASGYNGAPAGETDCYDAGECIMLNGHCLRAIHAEANLIAWAARTGTPLLGTQLYVTTPPCHACSKLILQSGMVMVVYKGQYSENGLSFLRDSNIDVIRWESQIEPRG